MTDVYLDNQVKASSETFFFERDTILEVGDIMSA